MGDDTESPDRRVRNGDKCGVTMKTGRLEWVCVAKVHDDGPGTASRTARKGRIPKADRHWFVPRFPARPIR